MGAKEPSAHAQETLSRLIIKQSERLVIVPRVALEQQVNKQSHRFWKDVAHEVTTHFRFGQGEPQHDWHVRYERSLACFIAISASYVAQQITEYTVQ